LGLRERECEQRDGLEDIRSANRRQLRPTAPPRAKPNKMMVASTRRPTDAAMRLRFGLPPKKEMMKKDSSLITVAKNNNSGDNGSLSTSTIFEATASAVCSAAVDATISFRASTTRLPSTTTTCSTSIRASTNNTATTSATTTNKSR